MEIDLNALTALTGVAWLAVVAWLVGAFLTWRGITKQRALVPVAGDRLKNADAPSVSVLVPARNEEHRILESAVRSMLAQDYENLEVIAVNDRSTDMTGLILRSIARTSSKLRVVEGVEPPAGWLGKPHALQQALDSSRGAWVLATDADMIFAPPVVRTAMAHALAGGYDAVTLLPRVDCLSFWERVFMPAFGGFMLMAMPLERVNDPKRAEALGVGGFFLIRRASLESVEGYRAVRSDVAEDLRMAETLKRTGARLRVEYAPDLVRTRMQTNFREIWEGFTKNLFAGAKFSFVHAAAGAAGVCLVSVLPVFVAGVSAVMIARGGGAEWVKLFVPTFAVWIVQVAIFAVVNRNSQVPAVYALTMPLGHALFVAILLNSSIRVGTGRGVTWKGRKLYERAGVRPPRRTRRTPDLPIADE